MRSTTGGVMPEEAVEKGMETRVNVVGEVAVPPRGPGGTVCRRRTSIAPRFWMATGFTAHQ